MEEEIVPFGFGKGRSRMAADSEKNNSKHMQ
jgi:hypothetical protein